MVPRPQNEWLDLRPSGPGFDGGRRVHAPGKARGAGSNNRQQPVYGPPLKATGLDRHNRCLNRDSLPHLDRVMLPILQQWARERPEAAVPILLALWQTVAQGRMCLVPEVGACGGTAWHADTAECAANSTRPSPPPPTGRGLVRPVSSPGLAWHGG